MAGIEPGCMIYDKLMRGFIWSKFQLEIPDLREEFSSKCWGCGRDSKDIEQNEKGNVEDTGDEKSLKTCSRCGVARWQSRQTIEYQKRILISVWGKDPPKRGLTSSILGAPDILLIFRSHTMSFCSGIVAGSARRATGKRWKITIIIDFYQGGVLLSKTVPQ